MVCVTFGPAIGEAAVTGVETDVRIQFRGDRTVDPPLPSEAIGDGWYFDATHARSSLDYVRNPDPEDPQAWYGAIDGTAEAHAVTRELKAYAELWWESHDFEMNFTSHAAAWYNETIGIAAPDGFAWGDHTLRIAFELDGSTDTPPGFHDTWLNSAYASLMARYSLDPEMEPMVDQATLDAVDENGLVYFFIDGYAGEAVDFNFELLASIAVRGSFNSTGYAEVDHYGTATYHSATILGWDDSAEDYVMLASFDGADFQTAGGPGWAVVPEPATLSLIALGAWAALRRRKA